MAQDSSSDKTFSGNERVQVQKMTKLAVCHVHRAPKEVFERDRVLDQKYTSSKLKSSITEISIYFPFRVSNLKIFSALHGKLHPFEFKQSAFCRCIAEASGQQASTAVTILGRKELKM